MNIVSVPLNMNGHCSISNGSISNGVNSTSGIHGGVVLDQDEAKYDRTIKKRLLLLQRKKRQMMMRGTGCGSSTTTAVLTAVSLLLAMTAVLVSYQNHIQVLAQRQSLERLQHAEDLWKQRQQQQQSGGGNGGIAGQQRNSSLGGPDAPRQEKLDLSLMDGPELQDEFARARTAVVTEPGIIAPKIRKLLDFWLDAEDMDIRHNVGASFPCWIRPYLLPPHPDSPNYRKKGGGMGNDDKPPQHQRRRRTKKEDLANFFYVHRNDEQNGRNSLGRMTWQEEYEKLQQQHHPNPLPGPAIDYSLKSKYTYPPTLETPPSSTAETTYPPLQSLEQLFTHWPQDQDYEGTLQETLQHFNYSDPRQLAMAQRFRDAELPFKLYGVPDVEAASMKWTDEYVGPMFGNSGVGGRLSSLSRTARTSEGATIPTASGMAQESRNNYFAFFIGKFWNLETMGLAPTRNNDWTYDLWSKHAQYADAVSLPPDQPHFYWQSGIPAEERHRPSSQWTFVSRDLPSLSTPTDNFFVFHVNEQKGIQCRFGERGVVAATHYDGGRNMVAMIKGAKRYILSPPNQCSKLGIFTKVRSPIYRHSLLNFGHIQYLRNNSINNTTTTATASAMSEEERAWLERAATSQAVETVLKQGEVLYIPSHWFHYIISLQKSAQCNVRSGIDVEGTPQFGGRKDVEECI